MEVHSVHLVVTMILIIVPNPNAWLLWFKMKKTRGKWVEGFWPEYYCGLSVTPFKINQNQNQNHSIDKVQNLGNETSKYAKTLAKIWVEGMIRIRDIRGNVLPKFIELCIETLYRHRNDPHHRNDPRHRNDPQSPPKWSPPPKWYLFAIEMIPS